MGGCGSTRWQWHTKKQTVEQSLSISIGSIAKYLRPEGFYGRLWWEDARGEQTSSINFTISSQASGYLLILHYTFTRGRNEGQEVNLPIRIQTTTPNYGGVRYWLTCPLSVNGRACGRRVAKLYLPPGALYYGCRHCYELSYASAQEAHRYDRLGGGLGEMIGRLDRLMREEKRLDRLYRREKG